MFCCGPALIITQCVCGVWWRLISLRMQWNVHNERAQYYTHTVQLFMMNLTVTVLYCTAQRTSVYHYFFIPCQQSRHE